MELKEIDARYSQLAGTDCCLSCGSAMEYAQVAPGEVCVDLGSGRGTDVIRMAGEAGETGFAYGIDIAEGMLEKSRMTAQRLGVINVCFIQSQLEKLPLQDSIADLVISNCTLNHAGNKQSVWNEIYRVMKNNGRFVISDIYATSPIPDEFRNDPTAVAECWAGAVTRDEYMNHLLIAGFASVEIIEESSPYRKGQAEIASFTLAGKKTANT